MGTFKKYPPWTRWVKCKRIVSEPTMYSACTCWVIVPSPPVEPALVRGMEYSASIGAMLLDELAFVYERTEEGMGRAVAGMERTVSDVDDRVDIVMRDMTDVQDRCTALEEMVQELRLDFASLSTRHADLREDYAHLDHNFGILRRVTARLMGHHLERQRNQAGGSANPIDVDAVVEDSEIEEELEDEDAEGSVVTDQSVGEEVEPEEVEVVHEEVYVVGQAPALIPIGPVLVEIQDQDLEYEDLPPLEPHEQDLPDPPAPPYVP